MSRSFRIWLLEQAKIKRSDHVGHLAADFAEDVRDGGWPKGRRVTLRNLTARIREQRGCSEAIVAAFTACGEWMVEEGRL